MITLRGLTLAQALQDAAEDTRDEGKAEIMTAAAMEIRKLVQESKDWMELCINLKYLIALATMEPGKVGTAEWVEACDKAIALVEVVKGRMS